MRNTKPPSLTLFQSKLPSYNDRLHPRAERVGCKPVLARTRDFTAAILAIHLIVVVPATQGWREHCRWPGQCSNPPRHNTGGGCHHQGQRWCRRERRRCPHRRASRRVLPGQRSTRCCVSGTAPVRANQTGLVLVGKGSGPLSAARRGKSPANPAGFRWAEARGRFYSHPTTRQAGLPASACGCPSA